jgi:MFS-type transporter involved in bile tolerance (Atg22 family)
VGWVGVLTGNPRIAIFSIIILFLSGAVILYMVDESEGVRMAKALEQV